jgi:hypothetical protein
MGQTAFGSSPKESVARTTKRAMNVNLVTTAGAATDVSSAAASDAVANPTSLQVLDHEHRWDGAAWQRMRTPNVFKTVVAVAVTATTGTTVWDPAAGKKFRLMGYCLSSSAAASLKFYEGLTTALTTLRFQGPLLAAAGIDNQGGGSLGNGILSSTVDMNLNLDVSANSTVSGSVWGTEE